MARSLQFREVFTEKNLEQKTREKTMKTTTTTAGLKVKSAIKAGGATPLHANHNRAGLKVKSAIKAGTFFISNHNRAGLKVKSAIKAGGHGPGALVANHNIRVLG